MKMFFLLLLLLLFKILNSKTSEKVIKWLKVKNFIEKFLGMGNFLVILMCLSTIIYNCQRRFMREFKYLCRDKSARIFDICSLSPKR